MHHQKRVLSQSLFCTLTTTKDIFEIVKPMETSTQTQNNRNNLYVIVRATLS